MAAFRPISWFSSEVHIFKFDMSTFSSRTNVDFWCVSIAILWRSDYFANHFRRSAFRRLHRALYIDA